MNFQGCKENIQPLAAGRNVEQLEVALHAESDPEYHEELLQQRKQFEHDILNYVGDDPLDLWFEYVSWVEQSYPKSGKESALDDLLKKCLSTFEKDSRYTQDPRLIRLFIKFIDSKKNPNLFYTKLYNSGVGTMVADLYIAWAHYYDIIDNFEQAKQVFEKGLDARAAPVDHLKQTYEKFQFSVGQRILHKDNYRQEFLSSMEEQRNAFTSLRSLKRSQVGSIRTGSAVRSYIPGQVRQNHPTSSMSTNTSLNVYEGAPQMTEKTQPQRITSVVEDIQNSMVENNIEPGPWSKASSRKSVFHNTNRNSTLKFAILEDAVVEPAPITFRPLIPDDGNLAVNLPEGFVRKNRTQTPFNVPSYVEDELSSNAFPSYDIFFLHPNKSTCFCVEELRHYRRCKERNVVNDFTKTRDKLWLTDSSVPMRLPPRFARSNLPCDDMETEWPDILSIPETERFVCKLAELYPEDTKTEVSMEELLQKNRDGNTCVNDGMDETVCVRGRQSFGVAHTRKSIVTGGRKSIMPLANDRASVTLNIPAVVNDDSSSDMEIDDGDVVHSKKFDVGRLDVKSYERIGNKQENAAAAVPTENDSKLTKDLGTKWSIFNDEESEALPTTPTDVEQKPNENVPLPPVVGGWSIFKDDEIVISPTIVSSKTRTVDPSDKEIFAVPQQPLSVSEKRTLKTDSPDIETPDLKRIFVEQAQYPIGPQTGAIKKSIRKSYITENALAVNYHPSSSTPFKAPNPALPAISHENTILDYSLCTQKFNINLAEQMASTPVATRRLEAFAEQIRAQDTQPLQPLKLSTIMETTEGSAHTASTKSSTQFSSPEDDDLSKRSNVMNRTKFVGAYVSSDTDASEACKTDSNPVQVDNGVASSTNYSCSVEKTLPKIQMSLLFDGTQNRYGVTIAATTDVPAKSYPFPIFEDTQTTTTIVNVSQPKPTLNESSSNYTAPPSDPPCPCLSTMAQEIHTDSLEPSAHDLPNSNQSSDSRFNMPSVWIKDEPQSFAAAAEESFAIPDVQSTDPLEPSSGKALSFTLNDSIAEESFALPNVCKREPSPQPISENFVGETVNKCGKVESHQTDAEPQTFHLNASAAEESFAIPKVLPNESSAQPMVESDKTYDLEENSDSEEEIIVVPDETLIETDGPKISQVQSLAHPNDNFTRISISLSESEIEAHLKDKQQKNASRELDNIQEEAALTDAANCDQSIYFKHNSIYLEPSWVETEADKAVPEEVNIYQHEKVNLEESRIFIETKLAQPAIDPFDEYLKKAILQELAFIHYLEETESSQLVFTVPTVTVKRTIQFKETQFDVLKCIGHGAYGRVYNVKSTQNGAMYAVKKEMPSNLWECYILREVHRRVVEDVSHGFMRIDMAIIGNNGSLLFSEYSPYGTLLDVCNRVFTSMQSHVNESIVFILAYQMLELIGHLHKADILHLDLKPDNFLVMKHISNNPQQLFIQLIDFGNAIDLQQFPSGQQFNAALETKHFVCIEMVEKRPWIYQPDLYCLAGTIHSVLFGKYMEVQKDGLHYGIKMRIPRYCNREVWSRFFTELINVREHSQPDLEDLQKCCRDAFVGDPKLDDRIREFNRFIVEKPK